MLPASRPQFAREPESPSPSRRRQYAQGRIAPWGDTSQRILASINAHTDIVYIPVCILGLVLRLGIPGLLGTVSYDCGVHRRRQSAS